jgi:hypothetical protein
MRVGSCSRAIKRDGAGRAVKKGDAKETEISPSFIDVLLYRVLLYCHNRRESHNPHKFAQV